MPNNSKQSFSQYIDKSAVRFVLDVLSAVQSISAEYAVRTYSQEKKKKERKEEERKRSRGEKKEAEKHIFFSLVLALGHM